MHIAILGATSQIAKDLILSFSKNSDHQLTLFARRPEVVSEWLVGNCFPRKYPVMSFDEFNIDQHFDVLINFIGIGNPVQAAAMGASIFDITLKYDYLALNYLQSHADCRYIFLSSGAAYGANFDRPVEEGSIAVIPLNNFQPQDWYSLAKLHAECRHRSLWQYSIVDVRVFNYFSSTQDMSARFLITDIVRAIQDKALLVTSAGNIVRDFLHPVDFYGIVKSILSSTQNNSVVDCYSKAPIEKINLLSSLKDAFSLQYEFTCEEVGINATGSKPFYYSLNRAAAKFGYIPQFTSLECVTKEIHSYLENSKLNLIDIHFDD